MPTDRMKPAHWKTLFLLLLLAGIVLLATHRLFHAKPLALPAAAMQNEPLIMLWAWETPEDLSALDTARAGVAFLSREITLTASQQLNIAPRRQPLHLAPNTWLMSVVRIDAPHSFDNNPEFRRRVIAAVLPAAQQPNVRALQLDFDAAASQLPFYADLLRELRAAMPQQMPLSITALTSWCGGSSWLPQLGNTRSAVIGEAVPMFFRMGGTPATRASLPKDTYSITQPLCAGSLGVATDETWPNLHTTQRVYIFRTGPWTSDDLERLNTHGATALAPPATAPEHTP